MGTEVVTQNHAIVTQEAREIAPAEILSVIISAAKDKSIDIDRLERLMSMHERISAEQRKTAFNAALVRLKAALPQITKDGKIIVKGQIRSTYAKYEDIDEIIRPLMEAEGFAFTFNSESTDGKLFKISATLRHNLGHSESNSIVLPIDSSDFRSTVQSIGSTVSYGKRQLVKMHLNLVEREDDDDGNGGKGLDFITKDQALEIDTLLSDSGRNRDKFLEMYIGGAKSVAEIRSKDYGRAVSILQAAIELDRKKKAAQ